jgi:IclR family pca regulon transcriptional regulator
MLSLARGLQVIRAFGDGRAHLSASDVARDTGLSRASARRCLHTLSVLGYAASDGGAFRLTPAVLTLGHAFLGSMMLVRVAEPALARLSADLHESSSVAVLDGGEIVYVARAATRRILSIGLAVGSRLPAACTSMGRVLLANLDDAALARVLARVKLVRHTERTIMDKDALRAELRRIRLQGFAIVDQELEVGLRSCAVPIRGRDGTVIAAINVGVQAGRADARTLQREFLPALRTAAEEIGAALSGAN